MTKHNLFEYKNKVELEPSAFEGLEKYLEEIWEARERSPNSFFNEKDEDESSVQKLLQFFHKDKTVKASKYVGVIYYENITLNLLPKIFYKGDNESVDTEPIYRHILWWLSYSKSLNYPSYKSSLSKLDGNLLEIFIHIFARHCIDVFTKGIYQQFENVEEELSFVKGRIDMPAYISRNLATGQWQKIHCAYSAFEIDNKFNRVVKFVAKMLFRVSNNAVNKRLLQNIQFILDDVTDIIATAKDSSSIVFNRVFKEYEEIRNFCTMFLENSIAYSFNKDLKLFAFLLPMERIFEEFVFGFIEKEVTEYEIAKKEEYLAKIGDDNSFKLKPDHCIKPKNDNNGTVKIIADTKYKIVSEKKHIKQSDLYQMIAYAIRFKCPNIVLFYPKSLKQTETNSDIKNIIVVDEFSEIKSETKTKTEITIKPCFLPIINESLFQENGNNDDQSNDICFSETKDELIEAITKSFEP